MVCAINYVVAAENGHFHKWLHFSPQVGA